MYNKIINPKTSKLVNINSKIGKGILNKYITVQNGGSSTREVDIRRDTPNESAQEPISQNLKPLGLNECGLTKEEKDDVRIWQSHYEAGWNNYTFGGPSESQREMHTRISAIEYQFTTKEKAVIDDMMRNGPAWWRKPGAVNPLMIWPGESRRVHFDRVHELIATWQREKYVPDQWLQQLKTEVIRQMSE